MTEVWKDIVGFEGIYQISNLGRVKSLPRFVKNSKKYGYFTQEKFLTAHPEGSGYLQVILYINKVRKTRKIHRLVSEAFIPNPNFYNEVNHKDLNKINNSIDNLEWCNRRENCTHVKNQGIKTSRYTGVSKSKDTKPRNKEWSARIKVNGKYKFLGRFLTQEEAANKVKQVMIDNGLVNKYALL